jgi:hypothetical protein
VNACTDIPWRVKRPADDYERTIDRPLAGGRISEWSVGFSRGYTHVGSIRAGAGA